MGGGESENNQNERLFGRKKECRLDLSNLFKITADFNTVWSKNWPMAVQSSGVPVCPLRHLATDGKTVFCGWAASPNGDLFREEEGSEKGEGRERTGVGVCVFLGRE